MPGTEVKMEVRRKGVTDKLDNVTLKLGEMPGLLPGDTVPSTVTGPPRTPVPPSVAAPSTESAPEPVPLPAVLLTNSVPLLAVSVPL